MALLPGDHPEQELTYIQKSELLNQGFIESIEVMAKSLKIIDAQFLKIEERLTKLEQDSQALHEIEEVVHRLETGG